MQILKLYWKKVQFSDQVFWKFKVVQPLPNDWLFLTWKTVEKKKNSIMASIINKFEHTNNLQGTETLALPHWTVSWNGQVK